MTERERIDYEWDWLGNQVGWDDDASSFYERSLGTITNGRTEEGEARPSALYLATNIDNVPGIEGGWDGAGWVEVDYGDSGNVESFTVHGECTDTGSDTCTDSPSDSVEERADNFRDGCTCGVEQHYSYRWDELNRLVDARRYDRVAGDWVYQTRLRYRYDAANQRTIEESFAFDAQNTSHRVALTVYPGHFERRGLERGSGTYDYQTSGTGESATETQYMIAGARIVWDAEPDTMGGEFDRNRRATVRVSDLLGTSSAVLDIESRELLEMATYYPSGARENLWTDDAAAPLEPIGFTGKEADEEIGAVYFGERWLIPRLGRWATPDPLHVHASGGGEALNSYHYVGGNLLQARDPLGLEDTTIRDDRPGYLRRRPTLEERQFWYQMVPGDISVSRNLLNHYMDATGDPYQLSRTEMAETAAYIDLNQGSHLARMAEAMTAPAPSATQMQHVPPPALPAGDRFAILDYTVQGVSTTGGNLGTFGVHVRGTLTVHDDATWDFNGEMAFVDIWDFDVARGGDHQQRTSYGESVVPLLHDLLPGMPFRVSSQWTPVTQSSVDREAQWAGLSARGRSQQPPAVRLFAGATQDGDNQSGLVTLEETIEEGPAQDAQHPPVGGSTGGGGP